MTVTIMKAVMIDHIEDDALSDCYSFKRGDLFGDLLFFRRDIYFIQNYRLHGNTHKYPSSTSGFVAYARFPNFGLVGLTK